MAGIAAANIAVVAGESAPVPATSAQLPLTCTSETKTSMEEIRTVHTTTTNNDDEEEKMEEIRTVHTTTTNNDDEEEKREEDEEEKREEDEEEELEEEQELAENENENENENGKSPDNERRRIRRRKSSNMQNPATPPPPPTPAMTRMLEVAKEADTEAMIAQAVGFPVDSLTEEEIEAGVVSAIGGDEQSNYIVLRNHILALWRENVQTWLTCEAAMNSIRPQHAHLVRSAYSFLLRHGYINFGFPAEPKDMNFAFPKEPQTATVIVIGAGLAGLAAARQLTLFGFKVAVLEARKRPGGRVLTKLMGSAAIAAAADLGGSVITGIHGNPLGVLARQLGFPLHKIRDRCPLYDFDGSAVDVGMDNRLEDAFNRLLERACQLRQAMDRVPLDVSLGTALETLRRVHGVAENVPAERRLWDWHLANLEYANAGLLSQISLAFWDQDDPYEMGGDHCFVAGGNVRFVNALAEGVPIFYDCPVSLVRYGSNGVQVVGGKQVFQADMVVCSVPLGVLKASSIRFEPELPPRKRDAIQRLGFGLLNKVAMLFDRVFWEPDIDTFGHLCEDPENRGEFFLFYSYASVSGGALLIALVAGEAAIRFESTDPPKAVNKVLEVLRGIYTPRGIVVPNPLETVCTRWGSEPFTLGSYSHISVGSSGDDYDILAESVCGRVFFAGEATNRRYPATMHGAFLSGMREAANICKAAANHRPLTPTVDNALSNGPERSSISISELFIKPDLSFGWFSVLFDPRSEDPNSMVLLRVSFSKKTVTSKADTGCNGQPENISNFSSQHEQRPKQNSQQLHLFCVLSRQKVLELREISERDDERLKYLCQKLEAKLVGRIGLGVEGEAILSAVKHARCQIDGLAQA
eukprot:TRINITY_DN2031_c0_g1_i1.p1 TRINITY_DN2031_c0_g1~~TRINITY_DN2031_c0_g1_i1.p1  ORF type:complete len:866 (+),score=120.55 TRINITY_DN2031_c0_g1_i1:53-2650(+)